MAALLQSEKFSWCDSWNHGTGKIFFVSCQNVVDLIPLRHCIYHSILKVRHWSGECGMDIQPGHIRKGDPAVPLRQALPALLRGLEQLPRI